MIKNDLILGMYQVMCFFAWKREQSYVIKKLDDWQSLEEKIVSVNSRRAVFSLLYFLTRDAKTNKLSWNGGTKLPLCAVL